MTDIQQVKIRAKVEIGTLVVETPYILSFNVRKARGQISTFDTTLKIGHNIGNITGDSVVIYAGEGSASKKIFTGIVKRAQQSPCFDDPEFSLLTVSGEDVLSLLRNRKYTRRVKATKACWASIDSVTRPGHKNGKFKYVKEEVLVVSDDDINKAYSLIKQSGPSAAWPPITSEASRVSNSDVLLNVPFKFTYKTSGE